MRLVRGLLALMLGLLIGFMANLSFAQSATPSTPPPTCEQQLEQARAENIDLTKKLGQSMFQSASVQEYALMCKKQLDAAKPAETPKAAAAPAPGTPPKK